MANRRAYAAFFVVMIVFLTGCASRRYDLTRSSTQQNVGVRAAKSSLWREALFRFQRAVQIDPESALAQNNLAVAYEGIGEFEKARTAYIEALRLDRSNQYIQKNYSRFVEFNSRNKKRQAGVEVATPSPAKEETPFTPPSNEPPPANVPPDQTPPTLNPPPQSRPPDNPVKPPATTQPGGIR